MDAKRIAEIRAKVGVYGHPVSDADLTARAFQIADEAMLSLVECEGVPHGFDHFAPADNDGREVCSVAHGSDGFREGVGWLVSRGIAEIARDDVGEFVIVYRERMKP